VITGALWVQLGAPQRLICIDVADARHDRLVEQQPLDLTAAPADATCDRSGVEASFERVGRDVTPTGGDIAGTGGVGHQHVPPDPTEGALVEKGEPASVVQFGVETPVRVIDQRSIGDAELPAHAEVSEQSIS
jgi:hypothetical protein